MKSLFLAATLAVATASVPAFYGSAQAAGCIKGAIVGGIVGHYAGNHGLAGAGVGCAIGHHEANKRAPQKNGDNADYGWSQDNRR